MNPSPEDPAQSLPKCPLGTLLFGQCGKEELRPTYWFESVDLLLHKLYEDLIWLEIRLKTRVVELDVGHF